jgi:rare lipoprotein A
VSTTAPPELAAPPPMPDSAGDAVPRVEPRSRSGNPPFYEVFGKRYYILSSSVGYWERGVASWYGPGFHKVRTSTGEVYDMYAMTAAHKTLPLPAYVRVTNLQNGRSVVVRVNDRGPFVGNRIIDLSYTAAARLDMLRNGTAMVEVRTVDPSAAPAVLAASEAAGAGLFVQAGAFSDPANAQRLADKLRNGSYGKVFVRDDQIAGRRMYRVRIGPVPDVGSFDRVVAALERAGINDAHLALD